MRYSCDVSADAMREAIRSKIPDGVYQAEDGFDADGVDDSVEYIGSSSSSPNTVTHIEIDLSGTSVQARSSVNCGPLDVKAAVGVALKMLIEQKAPYSSGCYRNIDMVIPPGTFCSARRPTDRSSFTGRVPGRCCWRCSARWPRRSARTRWAATTAR